MPVDADPKEEADILSQMTSLAVILDQMQKSGARINIALLDACRNNPFRVHLATDGLAQMQAPPGTLISFATQPRGVALDGDDGHSPYTRALAQTMTHPGYGLFKTFNEVGLTVEKDTHGAQLPWVSSSPISGNFYFAGKPLATPASLTAPDKSGTRATQQEDITLRRDLITDCDRLAAMPFDAGHAAELPGVDSDKIDVKAAGPACDDAMQRYPTVSRFVFEAGRVAYAKRNYAEAMKLYLKADEGGYRMAANNVGNLYEDGGFGVREDYAQAFRWYKQAADAGERVAMFAMAWLYETGRGVAKDCPEALRLYDTAGKAGLASAINNLGLMYDKGSCAPRDAAQAYRYFAQAAAQGDGQAMNNLGTLYNDGRGVPRDRKLAKQWFEKAAALGVPEAKQNLKGM